MGENVRLAFTRVNSRPQRPEAPNVVLAKHLMIFDKVHMANYAAG